jgi:hypothetical protein
MTSPYANLFGSSSRGQRENWQDFRIDILNAFILSILCDPVILSLPASHLFREPSSPSRQTVMDGITG